MKAEHKELTIKTNTLNSFIFSSPLFKELEHSEQIRMIQQSTFMEAYSSVLEQRIWVAIENG